MTLPEERRKRKLQKALDDAIVNLRETKQGGYKRDIDYRKVLTMRTHKVRALEKH